MNQSERARKKIRILVVDDNPLDRQILLDIISADEELEVVGEAKNGKEALEKTLSHKPHLVIMDLYMPVMDGLTAIEHIMASHPVPILVITGDRNSAMAHSAVDKGALEVLEKSVIRSEKGEFFNRKIKLLADLKVITHIRKKEQSLADEGGREEDGERIPRRAIAIACSTGGPKALSQILCHIHHSNFPPVLVAQHIAEGFVERMVRWLGDCSGLFIKIGEEGEKVANNVVYVAASRKHMEISASGRIRYLPVEEKDIYQPSCDRLLSSVALVFGKGALGVILTGMGDDGSEGIRRIKEAGGMTIAQDEETSTVFGMPKVAIEKGFVDKVLPLERIGRELGRFGGVMGEEE